MSGFVENTSDEAVEMWYILTRSLAPISLALGSHEKPTATCLR
jgi:hypothetical protein